MKGIGLAMLVVTMIFVAGCKRNRGESTEPLTYEKWTALPPASKYDVSTLERMKSDNPKFADDREWDRFMKTVLIPGKKKELPHGARHK